MLKCSAYDGLIQILNKQNKTIKITNYDEILQRLGGCDTPKNRVGF